MQCSSPSWVKVGDDKYREVACGRCLCCRKQRSREWAVRCLHEASLHRSSGFVTLTYSDDFFPADAAVSKDALQRFFKRLRKALGDRKVRYLACGEYGERRGRPHYHAAVFGLPACTCAEWNGRERAVKQVSKCGCPGRDAVLEAWKLGGVSRVTSVTWESALYVANYIVKADIDQQGYHGKTLPFQLMSKGLGRGYLDKDAVALRQRMGISVNGIEVGVPRYYLRRLEEFWPGTKEELESREIEAPVSKVAGIWRGTMFNGKRESDGEVVLPRLQRELEQRAKRELFKKDALDE